MSSVSLRLIIQLQSNLARHDYLLQVICVPDRALSDPEHQLEAWLDEQSADAWVLHLMPEAVQCWFSQNRPVACVFGARAAGAQLASVDAETSVAAQHAVGMLQRRGHRQIGLVRLGEELVGEILVERLMENAVDRDRRLTVIRCPADADLVAPCFERIFLQAGEARPTALVCTIPRLALYALTWLQSQQIRVPGEVSIVLLRSQPVLEFASPRLAHYEINESRVVTQMFPRLLDLLQSQTCETSPIQLIPEFVPGGSVADAVPV